MYHYVVQRRLVYKVLHASAVLDCPDSVNPEIRNYIQVSLISGSILVVFGRFLFPSNTNNVSSKCNFIGQKKNLKSKQHVQDPRS